MLGAIKGIDRSVLAIGNRWQAYTAFVTFVLLIGAVLGAALNWLRPFFPEAWGWPEAVVLGIGAACVLIVVASLALIAWRYFRPLVSEPSVPYDPELYSHDPEGEASNREAYRDLMDFTLLYLWPACEQRISLQEEIAKRLAGDNAEVESLLTEALEGGRNPKTSDFWMHFQNLRQGIDSSEPTIKFGALMDCIKGLERHSYRQFCKYTDDLAKSVGLYADDLIMLAREDWCDRHNALVDAYDVIKSDVRYPKLFAPLKPSRWGDKIPDATRPPVSPTHSQ